MAGCKSYNLIKRFFCLLVLLPAALLSFAQPGPRRSISLNEGWYSIASSNDTILPGNYYSSPIDNHWSRVDVPHNWDRYEGYRRLLHGNRHGDSWYRKTFTVKETKAGKRFFLFFEGVGSYATVYLNGKYIGAHAGGRTSFTIDATDVIVTDGSANYLAVRAYHPSGIKDLPWICGGCSEERGFSEGSQPMGIFRPVQLLITNDVRITPFGVHAWSELEEAGAELSVDVTLKEYAGKKRQLNIQHRLLDENKRLVKSVAWRQGFKGGDSANLQRKKLKIINPVRWSVEQPYLYQLETVVTENGRILDRVITPVGFRTIQWNTPSNQFLLNGKPVFINGIAEYEHILGQSHAFSNEQVKSRMQWIRKAGFNAFRDGHQPHHLLYGRICDEQGLLWWTQISAHIWYDSPAFRQNFKQLLREWVIERRNNPSVVLWGLQNESKLPEDFARECTALIRSLDPTASSERLVTTCNGGSGTDWDVPQNWTGTYGGNPDTYAADLKKQVLVGEYGAWRTLDLHTEGPFVQNGTLSEDRMVQLMEKKVRLAESVKDSSAGHIFWLLTSHDNPGRVQGGEGLREIDRIGPVNYKGLLTPWEEPTDAYYMFKSNYASVETEPMVYIVSHTWPNRWLHPGKKDSIIVYSNCDEVELFNDLTGASLGKRKRAGRGTHFQWDDAEIRFNLIRAVGYHKGKAVASDIIRLHHLPEAPVLRKVATNNYSDTRPADGFNYVYRLNCGGPAYTDRHGNTWTADLPLTAAGQQGSLSWADDFPGIPSAFASQRRSFGLVRGTNDAALYNDFRYGKDKLRFVFPLPDGDYRVELYFMEPWLGVGTNADHSGLRLFDVAANGVTVIKDLDIWKEAGNQSALKRVFNFAVTGGRLEISFPRSRAGQALISAIAIATKQKNIRPALSANLISNLAAPGHSLQHWLDIGQQIRRGERFTFHSIPPALYGASWLQPAGETGTHVVFTTRQQTDLWLAIPEDQISPTDTTMEILADKITTDEKGRRRYRLLKSRLAANSSFNRNLNAGELLFLQKAPDMQPAYDLKPVTQYRANTVTYSRNVTVTEVNGRNSVLVQADSAVSIQWAVQTGVADRYSFTVKYYYDKQDPVSGKVVLRDAGRHVLLDTTVAFTFTRSGKWNQFTVHTPSQINAGNYTLELRLENGASLAISGVDLQ